MKKNLDIIKKCISERYAIPQFNINNLEWAKYILEACEEEKSPVYLGVSVGASKYMGGYNTVVGMIKGLIKDLKITVPVIIHLDHAPSFEECEKAYNAGFDSLMIDVSKESLDKNIEITNKVATLGEVIVEAELGHVGGVEDDISSSLEYTDPKEAEYFCKNTMIDLFAPSLGTLHGLYKSEPHINFDLTKEISNKTKVGLVLHGGSGLSDDIYKKCIERGVVKINFNTEFQVLWSKEVREFLENDENVYDPRKIIGAGEYAIKETAKHYINVLGSKNKGVIHEENCN